MSVEVIPSGLAAEVATLVSGDYLYPNIEDTHDGNLGTMQDSFAADTFDYGEGGSATVTTHWNYYFKTSDWEGVHGTAIPLDSINVYMNQRAIVDQDAWYRGGLWECWLYVRLAGDLAWTEVKSTSYSILAEDDCGDDATRNHNISADSSDLSVGAIEAIKVIQKFYGQGIHCGGLSDTGELRVRVAVREISATTPISDSGLRFVSGDSDSTVYSLAEHDGVPDASTDNVGLRFGKDSVVHVLYVVDTDHGNASPLRVRTPDGIRSVRRFGE